MYHSIQVIWLSRSYIYVIQSQKDKTISPVFAIWESCIHLPIK